MWCNGSINALGAFSPSSNLGTPKEMITKIVTHFRPHADELIALIFLRNFKEGEEKFPGVKDAQIEFLASGKIPFGKTPADFPQTIFLRVGGELY